MFSITLISQVMMSVTIMAMTFFGRWFAFPRTIVFINLFISTIILFIWRVIVLQFYINKYGTSRVMIVGNKENCQEAVLNFKTSGTRQYKVTSVAFENYFENVKKNIDNVDVFYLLNFDSLEEEQRVLSYLTFNNKRIFLGTDFGNIL